MSDVFLPVRQARRMQLERFDIQESLTGDLPILIPAVVLSEPAGADAAPPAATSPSGANPAGSLNTHPKGTTNG